MSDRLRRHLQSSARDSSPPPQSDLSVLVDLYFHLPASAPLRKALAGYVCTLYEYIQVFPNTELLSVSLQLIFLHIFAV